MDSNIRAVVLISLDTDNIHGHESHEYITNNEESLTVEGITYTSIPQLVIDTEPLTGDFSTGEYSIKGLPTSLPMVQKLALNAPYPKVKVTVKELAFDENNDPVSVEYLFRGFLYQTISSRVKGIVSLVCKNWKYYTDTTAGIPCTELCAAAYFGDPLTCQKTVYTENNVVASVDHLTLTVVNNLTTAIPLLFNAGNIVMEGQVISIRYHDIGKVFNMSRAIPADWVGKAITIEAGCDRRLSTCKNIHNNEPRFLGLGLAMMSYNPLYEAS